MTWNYKIKLIQALCYIGGPLVLIFNFNAWYLFYAWLAHWLIVHIGISIGLHRCFAHNSWKPKNKAILLMLHFLTVINVVGSTITWTGIHRKHHAYSETVNDPHCPVDKSFWTKVAYWFNYWKPHKVNVKFVRDLINDPYHKFFHNNYFKVLISYMALLAVIDLDLFMYGFLVTTMFSLHLISWITVGSHLFGSIDNNTNDESRNTWIMGLYMWGEGWHNNHHKKPRSYEFGWNSKQPDFGKHLIRLLAKPKSLVPHE